MSGRAVSAPPGFVPYHRRSPYLDLIGPVFEGVGDPGRVGLWVDERHGNARGWVHGGLLLAVADTVMGHAAQRALEPGTRLITVSVTADFTGAARTGDWVEARAMVRRSGRRLSFACCEFSVRERLVLTASAVFATDPRDDEEASQIDGDRHGRSVT